MSIRLVCDGGCGETTDDHSSFEERGHADKRQYCKQCVKGVDIYLKARDELHTQLAKTWADGMQELNGAYNMEYENGLLPD